MEWFETYSIKRPYRVSWALWASATVSFLCAGVQSTTDSWLLSVRYPTAGSSAHAEAQPFYVNSPYGIVLAHNGNLTNTHELKHFLDADAHRHINTESDSEVLLNIFANNLQKTGKFRINEEDIFTAIKDLMLECKGGYACVSMLAGFGIIAFRDPCGIRPVGMAVRSVPNSDGKDYLFSSESVVADAAGFTQWEDVRAGTFSYFLLCTREMVKLTWLDDPRRGNHHHTYDRLTPCTRTGQDVCAGHL